MVINRAGQVAALGPLTDFEARVIADRGLPVVDVASVAADPVSSAQAALAPLVACDAVAVHFDVDLVDFLDAPLAENTNRGTAPSLTACGAALTELLADGRVCALTVTEFNTHHGSPDGRTTNRLLEVLVDALGALRTVQRGFAASLRALRSSVVDERCGCDVTLGVAVVVQPHRRAGVVLEDLDFLDRAAGGLEVDIPGAHGLSANRNPAIRAFAEAAADVLARTELAAYQTRRNAHEQR